jgi:hypothetical protein
LSIVIKVVYVHFQKLFCLTNLTFDFVVNYTYFAATQL